MRADGPEYNRQHLSLVADADSTGSVGVANDGYWGVSVQKNAIYRITLRVRAKTTTPLKIAP